MNVSLAPLLLLILLSQNFDQTPWYPCINLKVGIICSFSPKLSSDILGVPNDLKVAVCTLCTPLHDSVNNVLR